MMLTVSNSLRRQISRPRNLATPPIHMQPDSPTLPLPSPRIPPTSDPNSTPHHLKPPPSPSINPCAKPQLAGSSIQQSISVMATPATQRLCLLLTALSMLPTLYVLFLSNQEPACATGASPGDYYRPSFAAFRSEHPINLLTFPSAWNHLSFSASPPPSSLKIAVFVKKWPLANHAGGLERHALTLHLALARRGHEVHVFTTNSSGADRYLPVNGNSTTIHVHVTPPSPAGLLNQPLAWSQFLLYNASGGRPFDVVHTESVGLFHARARNLTALAVSWHGIAYETIHSDIVEELLRAPGEARRAAVAERVSRVVDEVGFFQDYAQHVATSDHVGDVLRRVYMIPEERVHVILNGVDEDMFRGDASEGRRFLSELGIPVEEGSMIMGVAGRLVRDKGHPIMFEALKQLFKEEEGFRRDVLVLVAGDGPWAKRYRSLEPNLFVLGPLEQEQLGRFYSSLDLFVNPTLRAQGLDHTFLEAMMSGVAVAGTRFASVTGSIVLGPEMGYTFLPTVGSLKEALRGIWREGKGPLKHKGVAARRRALRLFTATKMVSAYERLFLCMTRKPVIAIGSVDFCTYPLTGDN